jgi:hypothetical protein
LKEAVDNLVVTQKNHLPGQLSLIPEDKKHMTLPELFSERKREGGDKPHDQ